MQAVMYGEFCCSSCEYLFADHLPPLYEDMPSCPVCGNATRLHETLARRGTWAFIERPIRRPEGWSIAGAALAAWQLGDVVVALWPF